MQITGIKAKLLLISGSLLSLGSVNAISSSVAQRLLETDNKSLSAQISLLALDDELEDDDFEDSEDMDDLTTPVPELVAKAFV
jgi:hypothetical protein